MSSIKENLLNVRENIEKILLKTGRKDEVTLIAATKNVTPDRILLVIKEGIRFIGENRVQEAMAKYEQIKEPVNWHLIGHLQRNKVKNAITIFNMVQSIDKIETVLEIEKRVNEPLDILIEINSSGEETKSGIEPDKLFYLVDQLHSLTRINVRGLMTVGPLTSNLKTIRKSFSLMRKKFEELKEKEKNLDIRFLSMGMSSDYQIAIEEGSNMVRIGTAIFGERVYN